MKVANDTEDSEINRVEYDLRNISILDLESAFRPFIFITILRRDFLPECCHGHINAFYKHIVR